MIKSVLAGIVASQAAQRLEQETPAIHFWFNEGFSRAALGYLLKDVTERFARTAADKSGIHCIKLFAGPVQRVLDSGSACRSRPEAQGSIRPGYQQQAINVEDLERPLARRVRLSAGSARLWLHLMTITLRATCLNPADREDFCAFCGTFEVGRLYRDQHDSNRRWRWMLYWFFQSGRVGPFEGYKQTLDQAWSAIEQAWLSGSPKELHGLKLDGPDGSPGGR
jgi:hypothetical protein